MPRSERIADPGSLPADGRLSVIVDDIPALLVRIANQYFCIEDVCSHDGQPLTHGPIENCAIICPRHNAKFDLITGKPLCMPATEGIQVFPVEIRPDGIWVELAD